MNKYEFEHKCIDAIETKQNICIIKTNKHTNQAEYEIAMYRDGILDKLRRCMEEYDNDMVLKCDDKIYISDVKAFDGDPLPFIVPYSYEVTTTLGGLFKEVTCTECLKQFKVLDDDERDYGEFGCVYVKCPECGARVWLDDEEGLYIDEKNLEFPKHFYQFGKDNGSVHISDEEVNNDVRKVLGYLHNNPEETFYYVGSGDTIIIGLQDEESIYIYVARDFYEFEATYDKE